MKRRMSKSKIGYTSPEVPAYWSWEPFGYGCSQQCMAPRKCWAEIQCARQRHRCADCGDFKVHSHPERLCEPANTAQPGIVLGGFHADWLDPKRSDNDIYEMDKAMALAPWHVYVTLTKNAKGAAYYLPNWREPPTIYHGLTLRNQPEADAKLALFMRIPGKLWLSLEPLQDHIIVARAFGPWNNRLSLMGIIVGHDNRRGAPGTDTLDHIRSVVEQCKAAGVPVYVKQIWVWACPTCDIVYSRHAAKYCEYGQPHKPLRQKFLRASREDEFALYPKDLQLRQLPWTIPETKK